MLCQYQNVLSVRQGDRLMGGGTMRAYCNNLSCGLIARQNLTLIDVCQSMTVHCLTRLQECTTACHGRCDVHFPALFCLFDTWDGRLTVCAQSFLLADVHYECVVLASCDLLEQLPVLLLRCAQLPAHGNFCH